MAITTLLSFLLLVISLSIVSASTAPLLGACTNFGASAHAGVQAAGSNSMISGNVGATVAANTGFPAAAQVSTGYTVYGPGASESAACESVASSATTTAQASTCTASSGSELSDLTLLPGTYCYSSFTLSAGPLTLDGAGNCNSVFIFNSGSSIITASGTKVILTNGALAKNIFWSAGSAVTLGTTSQFYGTILAYSAINIGVGAKLEGRALAATESVTLDGSNTITLPKEGCANDASPSSSSSTGSINIENTPAATSTPNIVNTPAETSTGNIEQINPTPPANDNNNNNNNETPIIESSCSTHNVSAISGPLNQGNKGNCSVAFLASGTTCTVICDPGYGLKGDSYTCKNGILNGYQYCRPEICETSLITNSAGIIPNGELGGCLPIHLKSFKNCSITCNEGYIMSKESSEDYSCNYGVLTGKQECIVDIYYRGTLRTSDANTNTNAMIHQQYITAIVAILSILLISITY